MATWDSADLLARMKRYMRRPATDAAWADADLYALLTEAEADWKPILVAMDPGPMITAPTKLTSSDSGLTYNLPSSTHYIHVELLDSLAGTPLIQGAFWDPAADYALEGTKVRMCRGTARTFADGPYIRGVTAPGNVDGSTASTILPEWHRVLILFDALERWASIAGQMDPAYFAALKQKSWMGDPNTPGDIGILGAIRARNPNRGTAVAQPYAWWRPN